MVLHITNISFTKENKTQEAKEFDPEDVWSQKSEYGSKHANLFLVYINNTASLLYIDCTLL